jgi:hypothetical protein
MDDTYDVLRAYGIEQLPVPAQIWEPNHWFNHIPGQHYHIEPEGVDQEKGEKPMAHGPILADLASLAREPLAGVAPVPPAWRLAGTIEAAHFQESIKMTPPMPIMHRHFFAPLLRFFGVASQQRL